MSNLRKMFSRQYSFIPPPDAYAPLRAYQLAVQRCSTFKQSVKSRLPMNLRLSKISNLQKSFITVAFIFWAMVEYLERYT